MSRAMRKLGSSLRRSRNAQSLGKARLETEGGGIFGGKKKEYFETEVLGKKYRVRKTKKQRQHRLPVKVDVDTVTGEVVANPRKAKVKTRDQVKAMQAKAVRFLRDVVKDPDKAEEIAAMSINDYAAKKHITLSNPRGPRTSAHSRRMRDLHGKIQAASKRAKVPVEFEVQAGGAPTYIVRGRRLSGQEALAELENPSNPSNPKQSVYLFVDKFGGWIGDAKRMTASEARDHAQKLADADGQWIFYGVFGSGHNRKVKAHPNPDKAPLGSGARFAELESKLAARPGVTSPRALAAAIGRRKYGKKKFQQLAARGRKRAAKRGNPEYVRVGHREFEVVDRVSPDRMETQEKHPRLADEMRRKAVNWLVLRTKTGRGGHRVAYESQKTGVIRLINPAGESSEAAAARDLYETFHQETPREVLEFNQEIYRPTDYAVLGKLVELRLRSVGLKLDFEDEDVLLASNAAGTQMYFIGGNQDLRDVIKEASDNIDQTKDFIYLGEIDGVVYRARKEFTQFEETDWDHKLGEGGHKRPVLIYDKLNQAMYMVGGEYQVKYEGIIH